MDDLTKQHRVFLLFLRPDRDIRVLRLNMAQLTRLHGRTEEANPTPLEGLDTQGLSKEEKNSLDQLQKIDVNTRRSTHAYPRRDATVRNPHSRQHTTILLR